MVNVINVHVHCNDHSNITAMDIKLKSCPEESVNTSSQHLVARVSAAFNSLSLFSECGKNFRMELNPKRENVVNLHISLWENTLSFQDIGEFIDAFQKELLNSPF